MKMMKPDTSTRTEETAEETMMLASSPSAASLDVQQQKNGLRNRHLVGSATSVTSRSTLEDPALCSEVNHSPQSQSLERFRKLCEALHTGDVPDDADDNYATDCHYWPNAKRLGCFLYGDFPVSQYSSESDFDIAGQIKFLSLSSGYGMMRGSSDEDDDGSDACYAFDNPSACFLEGAHLLRANTSFELFNVLLPTFLMENLFRSEMAQLEQEADDDEHTILSLKFSCCDSFYLASLFHGLNALTSASSSCSLRVFVTKSSAAASIGGKRKGNDTAAAKVLQPKHGGEILTQWIKRFVEGPDFDQTLQEFYAATTSSSGTSSGSKRGRGRRRGLVAFKKLARSFVRR